MAKIIGHRGARGLAMENTLAGIEAAIAVGADMIEVDVRVTSDGVPVVIHDKQFLGPLGERFVIKNCTLKTLQSQRPDLPTFEEALQTINHRVPLIVEVKPRVITAPVVSVLKQAVRDGYSKNTLFLGSKSQRTLLALHRVLPALPTIVIEPFSSIRARFRARKLGTKLLFMNQHFLWFGFIKAVHHSKYQLYAYTLNDPEKAARWYKYGLSGVITDYPDRMRQ